MGKKKNRKASYASDGPPKCEIQVAELRCMIDILVEVQYNNYTVGQRDLRHYRQSIDALLTEFGVKVCSYDEFWDNDQSWTCDMSEFNKRYPK